MNQSAAHEKKSESYEALNKLPKNQIFESSVSDPMIQGDTSMGEPCTTAWKFSVPRFAFWADTTFAVDINGLSFQAVDRVNDDGSETLDKLLSIIYYRGELAKNQWLAIRNGSCGPNMRLCTLRVICRIQMIVDVAGRLIVIS